MVTHLAEHRASQPIAIEVIEGEAAKRQLAEPTFLNEWRALYEHCAWATPFQSPAFVTTWYEIYGGGFDPLVVAGRTHAGELAGLLNLAVTRDGRIVVAGGRQAEYQVWLSLPEFAEEFPPLALQAVQGRLKSGAVTFQYLPPLAPIEWLSGSPFLAACCLVTPLPRPIMDLAGAGAEQSLSSKSNKVLNRLGKLGDLAFDKCVGVEDLSAVLDQIGTLYDIRQGSMTGDLPFSDDPLKKPFHLALAGVPGLLHVTVFRLGSTPIAAHLGLAGRDVVHAGTLAHSPIYAKHSPGRLHVKRLGQCLAAEGFRMFDLTPGGDGWKERFATGHDIVRRLTVFSKPSQLTRTQRMERIATVGRAVLKSLNLSPGQFRSIAAQVRHQGAARFSLMAARRAGQRVFHTAELRVYSRPLIGVDPDIALEEGRPALARDVLSDVLRFVETRDSRTRQAFLRDAILRLEKGHHVYTRIENDRLVHYGWLAEKLAALFPDTARQQVSLPPDSAVLYDFYTDPAARRRGLGLQAVRQAMSDAKTAGAQQVYAVAPGGDVPAARLLEHAGLEYRLSLLEKTVLGSTRGWRTDGEVEQPSASPPPANPTESSTPG